MQFKKVTQKGHRRITKASLKNHKSNTKTSLKGHRRIAEVTQGDHIVKMYKIFVLFMCLSYLMCKKFYNMI